MAERRSRPSAGLALLIVLAAGATVLGLVLSGCGGAARPSRARRASARASGTGSAGASGTGSAGASGSASPVTVRVRIDPRATGTRIPPGFFGMSFETDGLADDEERLSTFTRVLAMVHAPGTGPTTIRIGGTSSQRTFLAPDAGRRLPSWAYGIGPTWIARTRRLVRADHLHLIPDLNIASATPAQAAALAHALVRGLPHGSIAGFELGNEPDIYLRTEWAAQVAQTPSLARVLPARITPDDYAALYLVLARLLSRAAPGVRLLGPALATSRGDRRWIRAVLGHPHPRLAAITMHRYPYSRCARPGAWNYPTVAKLLSERAIARMRAAVTGALDVTRRAGLPLRVTEFNSVTCQGVAGVSNTFATALWAPGALMEMAGAGVRSADLHARATAVNGPFRWDGGRLVAAPLLYGLLFFVRSLGPDARFVATHVRTSGPVDMSAWTVAVHSGARHLMLLNRSPRELSAMLSVPRGSAVSVQRLLAPTAGARTGVTLDGQRLDADAHWVGRRVVGHVTVGRGGRCVVAVPATSGALVTIARR